MLDQLTKKTFEPVQGGTFRLTHCDAPDDAPSMDVTLAGVQSNGLKGRDGREQFSLTFDGPRDPLLEQKMYHLEHGELGGLDLFLVPIARDDEGTTYEAVFT